LSPLYILLYIIIADKSRRWYIISKAAAAVHVMGHDSTSESLIKYSLPEDVWFSRRRPIVGAFITNETGQTLDDISDDLLLVVLLWSGE
jgi:hypothetical protein